MRAIEFIFESYPLAKKEFSRVADPSVVQTTIDQYKQLVSRNQFRNPAEKNINYWRERGWEAFSQMVNLKSGDISDTQRKRGKVVGEMITLQDDNEWIVLIPLDKEASVYYGRGTEWCTTKPFRPQFEDYVYEDNITLIYAIDKMKKGRSVAISINPNSGKSYQIQMFNQNDDSINATEYTKISGLDPEKFIQMAKLPENQQQLTASIKKYKAAKVKTAKLLASSPLNPEAIERELKITKNQVDCYTYILKYGQEQNTQITVHPIILGAAAEYINTKELALSISQYINFSAIPMSVYKSILRSAPEIFTHNFKLLSNEQQSLFSTTAMSAVSYASVILGNKPFLEGEPAIATDGRMSYYYATDVLGGNPFPAGEPAIAKSAEYSCSYAADALGNKPFPAGEPAIATSARWSYKYATDVLGNQPFPAGEPVIAADRLYSKQYNDEVLSYHDSPSWENLIKDDKAQSFNYALVRNRRFPAGEAAIAEDGVSAMLYASRILRCTPFPLGEPAIFNSRHAWSNYTNYVLTRHRSESWEQLIKDDAEKSYEYAKARNSSFPAGEAAIAKDLEYSFKYADNVLGKPFPAGEAAIARNPFLANQYDEKFGTNLAQQ